MKQVALLIVFTLLLATVTQAKVEMYIWPDIKDDFCGVHIGAHYCKCAFHDELCASTGLDKRAASKKVYADFAEYQKKTIKAFAWMCMGKGGIYHAIKKECEICEGTKVPNDGVCKDPADTRSVQEQFNLPKVTPDTTGGSINPPAYISEAEGEIFIYVQGLNKWIGPVKPGRAVFEGDIILTKESGRAELVFGGSSRLRLAGRTELKMPGPRQPERNIVIRGIINIWENIKRLANNEQFEIQAGNSIAGIKGTDFTVEVDDAGVATYTVHEGLIEVTAQDNPSDKREVRAGESVKVTQNGVQNNPYAWDNILAENGWTERDLTVPQERELPERPIDPDAVYPTEVAWTGDLVGELKSPGSSWWKWLLLLFALGGAGTFWWKRKQA